MSEIRTTKIDGQEFVTLTDYLRLKEDKQELEYLWDINEELKEENKNLNIIIENTKKEQEADREHIEELEEENKAVWILIDEVRRINEKIREENKKLKERIKELEATNKKRTADNWATFKS